MSLAEDPGNGHSFGETVAWAVADGVLAALTAGLVDVERVLDTLAARLAANGVPQFVHFNERIRQRMRSARGERRQGVQCFSLNRFDSGVSYRTRAFGTPADAPGSVMVSSSGTGFGGEPRERWGADFASGTAGVGWFLARLSILDGDPDMGAIAVEALRQSLEGVDELIEGRQLGFHEGAAGVAWASCDAGRALGCEELVERGLGVVRRVCAAGEEAAEPGLWNGDAGLLVGLLGLSNVLGEREVEAAAVAVVGRLTQWVSQPPTSLRSGVGLSYGASGIAAALEAWAARSNSEDVSAAARRAFRSERPWLSPGQHWYGQSAHTWTDDAMAGRSLCSGAAGIGLARLAAYKFTRAPNLLAEAAAAIELIRAAARTIFRTLRCAMERLARSSCYCAPGRRSVKLRIWMRRAEWAAGS